MKGSLPNIFERLRQRISPAIRRMVLVLVLIAVIGLIGKYALIPYVVEQEVRKELKLYWNGSVEIEEVEVNFLSPSRLRGVRLCDEKGRCWVSLGSLEARVAGILTFDFTIAEVVLDRLVVTAHFQDGKCEWPIRIPTTTNSSAMGPATYPDIHIRNATFMLLDNDGDKWVWDNFDIQTQWLAGQAAPDFRISRFSRESRDWMSLQGSVHPKTLEANLMFAITHTLGRAEAKAILDVFEAPVDDAKGILAANLNIHGRLNDLGSLNLHGTLNVNDLVCKSGPNQINSDADIGIRFFGREAQVLYANLTTPVFTASLGKVPLAYEGEDNNIIVRVSDARVRFPKREKYGPFWEKILNKTLIEGWANFNGTIVIPTKAGRLPLEVFQGQAQLDRLVLPLPGLLELRDIRVPKFTVGNGSANVPNLSFRSCEGNVKGNAEFNLYPFTYDILLDIESVSAGKLFRAINPKSKMEKGLISGGVAISATGFSMAGFHLNSLAVAENVDFEVNPIFFNMFHMMNVRPDSVRSTSDFAIAFNIDYPMLTINKARLANRASAMDVEPGGNINLETGQLDFYVVGGKLNDIKIGLLTPGRNLAKRITRLQVQGHWSDPPNKLIHKAPLADLAEGTLGFFVDWLKVGGDFGASILRFFGPTPSQVEPEDEPTKS
ncbi:MAG: AsmA-like C-terminal region-containing protein [Phycisphaerae bacterium]|nr:AsmA-like C-terminal region-containing protein [Phycisphaerae bacterium]